jgi:hypothetical protein
MRFHPAVPRRAYDDIGAYRKRGWPAKANADGSAGPPRAGPSGPRACAQARGHSFRVAWIYYTCRGRAQLLQRVRAVVIADGR